MADVKVPSKLHTMSPTFQKAWYKKNKMELPLHLTGSVKQASKEVKPSERVKDLLAKSLKAYGATKGTKVGGEHGSSDEVRDTVAPLTRDQHSKVQAAARAAKKTPLTKGQRMAAIAAAVRKAQTKHDVATLDNNDEHDDLADVHQSLHIKKSYNEETDRMAVIKAAAEKKDQNKIADDKEKKQKSLFWKMHLMKYAANKKAYKKPDSDKTPFDRSKYSKSYNKMSDKMEEEVQQVTEGFDTDPADIAAYLVNRHGKGKVTMDHIEAYERGRDSHRPIEKHEVMKYVKKMSEEVETIDESDDYLDMRHTSYSIGKQVDPNDPLGGRGLFSGDPSKQRNLSTERGKKNAAKRNISMLKTFIKSSLGKHGNPNLPEEVELDEAKKKLKPSYWRAEWRLGTQSEVDKNNKKIFDKLSKEDPEKAKAFHDNLMKLRKEEIELEEGKMNDQQKPKDLPFTPDTKKVRRGPGGPMSQAKWLAKHAMMKKMKEMQKEETIVEEVKDAADVGEYDYEGDMAKSQLRSILTNAKRLHDMLEDTTNLPEWVQSKITLAEDYILTAANYMEGEMNEEKKGTESYPLLKAGEKLKPMKLKVAEETTEESAEQVEEKYMGFAAVKKAVAAKGARNPAAVAAAIGRKKYGKEKFQAMAAAGKKAANEEVEQIMEGDLSIRTLYNKWADHYTSSEGNSAKRADAVEKTIIKVHGHEVMNHLKKAIKANLRNDMDQEENHFERARNAAEKSGSDRVNATVGKDRSKFRKEEVEQVTEAEGTVAVTPKEKELAAHHGDKTKITYGDVIKARIKSAAEKAMKAGK